MGAQMTAIARFLARRVPASDAETDVLKQLALLACAGLLVSLLMMTYGVDLSPGFF
jgi:ribose/xylose/arabinose/galactoside ABC-type transport system permease subunit